MIPILFEAAATDFSTYGIGALAETTSCIVTEERNGEYELEMKYPVNGRMYSYLAKERIIKAKPNETSDPQAFRIYRITVPIGGIVTIYAQHISYDLGNIALQPFSLTDVTAQEAMDYVLENALTEHNFTFTTDYEGVKDFEVTEPQSVRACIGGTTGSLIYQWGGELEWDNFSIIHHQGRGANNGVVIEYGKNLTKLTHDSDLTEVYSHLMPYAVYQNEDAEDVVVTLSEGLLEITNSLAVDKTLIKDFSEYFETGEEITEDDLREVAETYTENNPLGEEDPEITISFEPLWKQAEYAALLERVSLCDTVTVKHTAIGITTKTKVVETEYDVLAEKYTSITLGSCSASLLDSISDTQEEAQSAITASTKAQGLVSSAVSRATQLITGNLGGYVVIRTETGTGYPYEILIMDEPDLNDAVNVWRWNLEGLGYSSSGYNGPYELAITASGEIVANFITAGTLNADILQAGTISSASGGSYWNLETGELVFREEESDASFGWAMTPESFSVTANNEAVLEITADGLSVTGEINADSGTLGDMTITGTLYFGEEYYISAGEYYVYLPGLAINAEGAEFSGTLSAPGGTIGGFSVSDSSLTTNEKTDYNDAVSGVYIGSDGIGLGNGTFYVTEDGALYASSGAIGGFSIGESAIYNGRETIDATDTTGIYIGVDGISIGYDEDEMMPKVKISSDGELTATDAAINGTAILSSCEITTLKAEDAVLGTLSSDAVEVDELNFLNTTAKISTTSSGGSVQATLTEGDADGAYRTIVLTCDSTLTASRTFSVYYKRVNGRVTQTGTIDITVAKGSSSATVTTEAYTSGTFEFYFVSNSETTLMFTDGDVDAFTFSGNLLPETSGSYSLGDPSRLYSIVYAQEVSDGSDRKLKSDIEDLEAEFALRLISRLRPRTFRFNNFDVERKRSGFIAQEVEEILEEMGFPTKDFALVDKTDRNAEDSENNRYTLSYTGLIAPMVKVIQTLMHRLERLENLLKGGDV